MQPQIVWYSEDEVIQARKMYVAHTQSKILQPNIHNEVPRN